MINLQQKNNIALFIAILVHVSGIIGILFSPYREWFISCTPLNLLLMAGLLIFTQHQKNAFFYFFIFICFAAGMIAEGIGVNSGYLFGDYVYGEMLGKKIAGVPLIIGLNWFVIIFCACTIIHQINRWAYKKMPPDLLVSTSIQVFSFIADTAILATLFDWVMEPVAVRLGFWKWVPAGEIPLYNFLCWFIISAALAGLFRVLKFDKHNQFAVHLFIIQLLFFLGLQTFL